MKTICAIFIFAFSSGVFAQVKPVKIVFDVTSKDTLVHQAALRHVSLMAQSYPQSPFEVVIYGGAIAMVENGKSTVANAIKLLEKTPNVSFKVCEATMKRYNVTKAQLLPSVSTVPDAIIEIVNKQGEGWGYIKEAH
ncbi:MAG TPA: DsrE family protein [Cyclobacteriaceae bacterium]|nr:DsrE family protein [Cyclobacteriaceae bacterium]